MCKEFGVLPGAGGVLDQDWLYIEVFSIISSVWAEERAKDAAKARSGRG